MSKVQSLLAARDAAHAAHEAEKGRLAALGMNSKARYEALKPLKAAVDEAHALYYAAAKRRAHAELTAAGFN